MKKFFYLVFFIFCTISEAALFDEHDHDDIFGERSIRMGIKVGPQVSGYTPYKVNNSELSVQSSVRAAGGLSVDFIYELFRYEINLFWNTRGWIRSGGSLHALSYPAFIKLPWTLSSEIELEFGLGPQVDLILTGPSPHRSVLISGVAKVGFIADLDPHLFNVELRYVHGIPNIDNDINGAKSREFQLLIGLLWEM